MKTFMNRAVGALRRLDTERRREWAYQMQGKGVALREDGDDEGALQHYRMALEVQPTKSSLHYNAGLVYKYRGDWPNSFRHNLVANAVNPDSEAARWNLAIAATALRDWATARRMWQACGVIMQEGEGPIDADCGDTPVRLNPDGDGEVVWARRIDPVRARINNVPLPGSGYCFGDIVLHDGAAVGHRMSGDREYPVFNVLEPFEDSSLDTYEVNILAADAGDVARLDQLADAAGLAMEDWTANFRVLCKACSEGTPHEHDENEDDDQEPASWDDARRLGIAAGSRQALDDVLAAWESATGKVVNVALALAAAGRPRQRGQVAD